VARVGPVKVRWTLTHDEWRADLLNWKDAAA
jgi:hypothetical protein